MSIKININLAKEIHIERWRISRAPLLGSLDIEFMKAVEGGDEEKKQEISLLKQELRDVTLHDLSNVNSTEELSSIWPSCLGEKPEEYNV
jgi:hypothetical protein